jgi:hypothetical protein
MIFTLGYAKTQLAKFVDNGLCSDNTEVIARINEAIMQLLLLEDWQLTVQRMKFHTHLGMITLPYFVDKIVACRFDDASGSAQVGTVWSKYYEFMEGGPLTVEADCSGLQNLIDWGDGWSTAFDIDRASTVKLVAFSPATADALKVLRIRGVSKAGNELGALGLRGAELPINYWMAGVEGDVDMAGLIVSDDDVIEITQVIKPETVGYVSLYTIDPVTNAMTFLSKYHPSETNPGYHRYKIKNVDEDNGTDIPALVKVRYVPAVEDDDPLLVQNVPALKAMLQALSAKDAGNVALGREYATECLWLLGKQMANAEPNSNEFQVQDQFGLGGIGSV